MVFNVSLKWKWIYNCVVPNTLNKGVIPLESFLVLTVK
nr:MAG TPA: hypothetical protein [Caudoviricetes sp.]DAL97285.1 MAG TPA: hypothetical protein [Caudoviricetes sp.]